MRTTRIWPKRCLLLGSSAIASTQVGRAQLVSITGTCVGSGVTLYFIGSHPGLEAWKEVGARVGPAVFGPTWAVTGKVDEPDRIIRIVDAGASVSDEFPGG